MGSKREQKSHRIYWSPLGVTTMLLSHEALPVCLLLGKGCSIFPVPAILFRQVWQSNPVEVGIPWQRNLQVWDNHHNNVWNLRPKLLCPPALEVQHPVEVTLNKGATSHPCLFAMRHCCLLIQVPVFIELPPDEKKEKQTKKPQANQEQLYLVCP